MDRRLWIVFALVGGAASAAACGLDVRGTPDVADDAGSSTEPTLPSTSADASVTDPGADPDAAVQGATCDASTCGVTAEPGWSLVAFGDGPCPAATVETSVIENPTANANACSCSPGACTVTSAPSCPTSPIASSYDDGDGTCGKTGPTLTYDGSCVRDENTLGKHVELATRTASGGSCSAPASADDKAVSGSAAKICATASCDALCSVTTGVGSLAVCLVAPGDKACPASAPTKHLVGTGTHVACGACGCTVQATCGGTMTFFNDPNCKSATASISPGSCEAEGNGYKSYRWSPSTTTTCTPHDPPAGVASLTGVHTVCCH